MTCLHQLNSDPICVRDILYMIATFSGTEDTDETMEREYPVLDDPPARDFTTDPDFPIHTSLNLNDDVEAENLETEPLHEAENVLEGKRNAKVYFNHLWLKF